MIKVNFLLIILFSIVSIKYAHSEIYPEFYLEYCLDSSTHIIRAELIDEKGNLKIKELIKGKYSKSEFHTFDFTKVKNHKEYIPEKLLGWNIIIFLKQKSDGKLVPAFAWGVREEGLGLALATVWVKDNDIYYSTQIESIFPPQFQKQRKLIITRKFIDECISIEKKVSKIQKIQNCNQRIKKLTKLYSQFSSNSRHEHRLSNSIIESPCDEERLLFLKNKISKRTYSFREQEYLHKYISFGDEKVEEEVNEVFVSEFEFWQSYLEQNRGDKWWQSSHKNFKRFYYFKTLITSIAQNKMPDWEAKLRIVIDRFKKHKEYRKSDYHYKIYDALAVYLKE